MGILISNSEYMELLAGPCVLASSLGQEAAWEEYLLTKNVYNPQFPIEEKNLDVENKYSIKYTVRYEFILW